MKEVDVKNQVIEKYIIENSVLTFKTQEITESYFKRLEYFLLGFYSNTKKDDNYENKIISNVSQKILKSLKALEWKYKFVSDLKGLSISPSSSGFPHFSEILELKMQNSKSESVLSDLPTLDQLTNRFVSEMLDGENSFYVKNLYSERKLNELVSKSEEILIDFEVFTPIVESGLHKIAWVYYDTTINLPVVYLMEYENDNHYENLFELKDIAKRTFKNVCNSNLTMYNVAKEIDDNLEDIAPKKITRITIGPFFMKDITKNNEMIQNILDIDDEIDGNILSWTKEIIFSYDEDVENGFFKSKRTQKFYIDKTSEELSKGGMSELKRFNIVTYDMYQKYNSKNINSLLNYSENIIIK